jgi:hypothetical protein
MDFRSTRFPFDSIGLTNLSASYVGELTLGLDEFCRICREALTGQMVSDLARIREKMIPSIPPAAPPAIKEARKLSF